MSGYFRDPNGTEGGHLRLQAFDGKNLVVDGGDWLFSFCRLLVSTILYVVVAFVSSLKIRCGSAIFRLRLCSK